MDFKTIVKFEFIVKFEGTSFINFTTLLILETRTEQSLLFELFKTFDQIDTVTN